MQFIERAAQIPWINKAQPITWVRIRFGLLAIIGLSLGIGIAFLITHDAVLYAGVLVGIIPAALFIVTYPFTAVLLWLLIMPFVSAFPNSEIPYWAVYRLLIPIILIMVLVFRTIKVRPYPSIRFGPPELAMAALFFIVPTTILLSPGSSFRTFIQFGDRIVLPFCMYLAIRLLPLRDREFYLLQWTALFIVLSQSLIGFLSWFAPHFLPSAWRHLEGFRTTGSLMDADLYAAILIFSTVLLIQGAIQRESRLLRFLFFAASGLSFIFVFLSLERAAWLGGVFVIIGLVFLFRRVMIRLILIGLIVMAVLGTGMLSSHVSLSMDRFGDTGPIYDRMVVMDAMVQMFQIKPLVGWGYDTLDQNLQQFYRRVGDGAITRTLITSHNTYMTIITEQGVVGFMLYIFPAFWWFALSVRAWQRMPKEGLLSRNLLGVFWLSMLFNFIVSNFMDMRYFMIGITLWWMALGFIANLVYPYLKFDDGVLPDASPSLQE